MAEPTPAYDVNFCFPVTVIENERIELTPFIPHIHGPAFYDGSISHPELFTQIPFGPFPTLASFTDQLLERRIRADPTRTLFAIIDKATDALAGMIGLLNSSADNLVTELGPIIVLPPFQRTHVSSHAIGLMLVYLFNGLHLRRVQWKASANNSTSVRAAERMGFVNETVCRWERVLPGQGKVGHGRPEPAGRGNIIGRDTVILAICWDEWKDGTREAVMARMQ